MCVCVYQVLLETCDVMTPRDSASRNHLHWGVRSRDYEIFTFIFEKWNKDNLLAVDCMRRSILHWAVLVRNLDMIRAILLQQSSTILHLIHIENKNFKLPLHLAAERNNVDAVKLFLEIGQDINVQSKCPNVEFTPLICAARECAFDVIDYLLSIPTCNINHPSIHSKTALFQTVLQYFNIPRPRSRIFQRRIVTVIYKLLAANADMTVGYSKGILRASQHELYKDVLTIAVKRGLQDVVEMLIFTGCSLVQLVVQLAQTNYMLDNNLSLNMEQTNRLNQYLCNPLHLQTICRRVIREHMGEQFRFTVIKLPLPPLLKEYLCLSDLRHYCEQQ